MCPCVSPSWFVSLSVLSMLSPRLAPPWRFLLPLLGSFSTCLRGNVRTTARPPAMQLARPLRAMRPPRPHRCPPNDRPALSATPLPPTNTGTLNIQDPASQPPGTATTSTFFVLSPYRPLSVPSTCMATSNAAPPYIEPGLPLMP